MKKNKRTINRSLGKKRKKRFKDVLDRDQQMIAMKIFENWKRGR